jgi:hypothetical protein
LGFAYLDYPPPHPPQHDERDHEQSEIEGAEDNQHRHGESDAFNFDPQLRGKAFEHHFL